jgi:hypothetical protein
MRIPEVAISVGHEVAVIHSSAPSSISRKPGSTFDAVLLSRSGGDGLNKKAFPAVRCL